MRVPVFLRLPASLALAALALAGAPSSGRAQGPATTAAADDSLEVWRLPADSLIGRMVALKHLFDGNGWGSQVFYATYDMLLHTTPPRVDPTRAWFELWPQVMPLALFTRFERDGIMDPRAGRAYRNQILAPAGTEEPDVLMRRFLGREVSDAAFFRELGLAGDTATRAR